MSIETNTWSTNTVEESLQKGNTKKEIYAHENGDNIDNSCVIEYKKDSKDSIEENSCSIIKQNNLIQTNNTPSSTIPINHHSTILQNKIFEKRDISKNKAPRKKIVSKEIHEEIDIEKIQDIVTVEYKKPQPKPKSGFKKFFEFLFTK